MAYNTRWNMVQALGINNDNYKMGSKMRIYKMWYKVYKMRRTIYKLYRNIYKLHQGFGYWVGTPREQAGGVVDGEWMDER